MLPDAAEQDRGAFGRIITALFGPGIDAITLGDIGLVRDWLDGARRSRIDNLREQLEPNWHFPATNDGHIPDDLPGLDEVKPPIGTADSGRERPGGAGRQAEDGRDEGGPANAESLVGSDPEGV